MTRREAGSEGQPSSVILKASWQTENRTSIEADVFQSLDGAFGTAKYFYCTQPLNPGGEPASNIAFLPKNEEIESCFWDVFSKKPQNPPDAAEKRYLVLTLLETEGTEFTYAETADDLVEFLMHSVLGTDRYPSKSQYHSTDNDPQGGGRFIKLALSIEMLALATYLW